MLYKIKRKLFFWMLNYIIKDTLIKLKGGREMKLSIVIKDVVVNEIRNGEAVPVVKVGEVTPSLQYDPGEVQSFLDHQLKVVEKLFPGKDFVGVVETVMEGLGKIAPAIEEIVTEYSAATGQDLKNQIAGFTDLVSHLAADNAHLNDSLTTLEGKVEAVREAFANHADHA